ncbi:hypothetical protein VSR82_25335 [Burkholderia sp. JPY481]
MKKHDFVVLIPTHRRPDHVLTYHTLRQHGYTGRIVLIVDNEDETIEQYRRNYAANEIVVFDKAAAAAKAEAGDNFPARKTALYAFNATFEVAAQLGYTYFILLDDDYRRFEFRRDSHSQYCARKILSLDDVFRVMFDYFRSIPALSIAMAQTGDFAGGAQCVGKTSHVWGRPSRKVMNSFFCSTERPFTFLGRLNADVNMYLVYGSRGGLFLTHGVTCLQQEPTQANSGGMSEIYKDYGTYVKSFYSVMYAPAAVKVSVLKSKFARIHHQIRWRNAVPRVLSEAHRKARAADDFEPADNEASHADAT